MDQLHYYIRTLQETKSHRIPSESSYYSKKNYTTVLQCAFMWTRCQCSESRCGPLHREVFAFYAGVIFDIDSWKLSTKQSYKRCQSSASFHFDWQADVDEVSLRRQRLPQVISNEQSFRWNIPSSMVHAKYFANNSSGIWKVNSITKVRYWVRLHRDATSRYVRHHGKDVKLLFFQLNSFVALKL